MFVWSISERKLGSPIKAMGIVTYLAGTKVTQGIYIMLKFSQELGTGMTVQCTFMGTREGTKMAW